MILYVALVNWRWANVMVAIVVVKQILNWLTIKGGVRIEMCKKPCFKEYGLLEVGN